MRTHAITLVLLLAMARCAPEQSAVATKPLPGDVAGATGSFDGASRAQMAGTMDEIVPPGFVPLTPAALGERRWPDVPAAVATACESVEMTTLSSRVDDSLAEFELITIDSRPGRMVVRRVDEPILIDATATVGNFQEDVETAKRLVAALNTAMDRAAKQRKLADYTPR
ncbi:MAG: hypothetical protein U0575_08170 [Phycisphaerales bacterium]